CGPESKAGPYPPNISWTESGKRSRAFRGRIRCYLWSRFVSGTDYGHESYFAIGRRSHGQSARFWGDAHHRRRDLGLATRPAERAQSSETRGRARCEFDRHGRRLRTGNERTADRRGASSLSERARYRHEGRSNPTRTESV